MKPWLTIILLLLCGNIQAQVRYQYTEEERDDDGDLIESRAFSADSTLVNSCHYIYSRKGEMAAMVSYEYNEQTGAVEYRSVHLYRNNQLAKMTQYSVDEQVLCTYACTFDRKGRATKVCQISYHDDGDVDKTITRYKYYENEYRIKSYLNGKLCSNVVLPLPDKK